MQRKLLFLERLMLGDGRTPFNGVFVIRIKGTITMELLRNALDKLQAKHPLLRAGITYGKDGSPYFKVNESCPEIPVTVTEQFYDDDWVLQSINDWATVFDTGSGPLIKLHWISGVGSSDLVMAFHHCMCDGGAGLMLIKDLVALLDNPARDIGRHDSICTIEEIVPATVLNSKGRQLKARFQAMLIRAGLRLLAALTTTHNKPRSYRERDYLVHWKLSPSQSAALFKQCTAQGVTVNTALCVAFLEAFRQVKGKAARNKITCPVDIRKFVKEIRQDTIFSFGLSLTLSLPPSKSSFWEKVRELQQIVSKKMDRMDPYDFLLPFEQAHSSLHHIRKVLTYGKVNYDLMFS
ncbi:MAG TPA: condensation domain-containing protein, partial [Chitinophaga sp.]|nr:condensation domain-containing protein [Chitinophaga sp.]